jgi:hypothetical protein
MVIRMPSKENPYAKRAIQRRIKAALDAGLKVVGVAPDNTIITEDRENPSPTARAGLTGRRPLRDARDLLG